MLNNRIITKLLSLQLPINDYAVFGSAIMYFHGLKDLEHDIDILARGAAWEKAKTLKAPTIPASKKGQVIQLFNSEIEIFTDWYPGDWDIDNLIDGAETIGGIKVIGFTEVIKWKKLMGRDKDLEHIRLIEEYLKNKS